MKYFGDDAAQMVLNAQTDGQSEQNGKSDNICVLKLCFCNIKY